MALAVLSTPPPTFAPTPIIFPPEQINEIYTYASYSKEATTDLVENGKGHWTFSLDVPIPDKMVYPTLTYLEYTVKYGIMITNKQGTSTMRTRIMLTKVPGSSLDAKPTSISNGHALGMNGNGNGNGVGLAPHTLQVPPTLCLSSTPAVKENFRTSQWNHYLDQQQLLPHIRIIDNSRLHLELHVTENPTPLVLRSLVINVSATWAEDMQAKILHDEIEVADMKTASAQKKMAEDNQARLQAESKSNTAIMAKDSAEKKEEAAKQKSQDDQLAKKHADDEANEHRDAKKRAESGL
ncbi:hypothetical protein DFJ58DRAFT_782586 [Suillus subalutaceus]|uniref:uncharacterized protein n=1 Tax=Suillus subalutaceus TaxID=48586 RepID=UPI001B874023|nr:uncharacterized protein DFJ58DRAFT_782586 [Suillus subalutaceus]KAG1858037.1 hypothetical protein DFJ58DRAFT_782586 [Suillus subalutaceus]